MVTVALPARVAAVPNCPALFARRERLARLAALVAVINVGPERAVHSNNNNTIISKRVVRHFKGVQHLCGFNDVIGLVDDVDAAVVVLEQDEAVGVHAGRGGGDGGAHVARGRLALLNSEAKALRDAAAEQSKVDVDWRDRLRQRKGKKHEWVESDRHFFAVAARDGRLVLALEEVDDDRVVAAPVSGPAGGGELAVGLANVGRVFSVRLGEDAVEVLVEAVEEEGEDFLGVVLLVAAELGAESANGSLKMDK